MNIMIYSQNAIQISNYLKRCQKDYSHIPMSIDIYQSHQSLQDAYYDVAYLDGACDDSLLQDLLNNNPQCLMIIMGHHQEHLQKAFLMKAFQYISYHMTFPLFQREFRRTMLCYQNRPMKFLLRTSQGNVLFRCREILYIETYYKHMKIVTTHQTYLADIKQKEGLFPRLNHLCFIKIHQSYLVNINHIQDIQPKYVELTNGEKLPTSSLRSEEIIIKYNQFYQCHEN